MLKQLGRLFSSSQSRKNRYNKQSISNKSSRTQKKDYSCVEIKTRSDHCPAVEHMMGERYLTADAPWLPLEECTNKHCSCRYIRYDDRRMDMRRDVDIGITRNEYADADRRSYIRGRRQSDKLGQSV